MSLFKKKRPIYVQGVKLYPIIVTELYTEENIPYFYYKDLGLRRSSLRTESWGKNFPFF